MGLAFAEHLAAFAQVKGVEIGTITAIEQNPEQSKHLETATFKIFGLDIDLVNLRSEEYAESSRIPTQVVSTSLFLKIGQAITLFFNKSFGTPLQDALRRDITINSLFYNVHTHKVEDFTGKVAFILPLNSPYKIILHRDWTTCETALLGPLCLHERHSWTILYVCCAVSDLPAVLDLT